MTSYTIYLKNGSDIQWSMQAEHPEFITGMIAASLKILRIYNDTNDTNYLLDANVNLSQDVVSQYLFSHDIKRNSCGKLTKKYGIWAHSEKTYQYNLYQFDTPYFMQGFISFCQTSDVEFRDYIYGLIFDNYNNQYSLEGYVMSSYLLTQNAFDIDDTNYENKDNENLSSLLEKDY